MTRCSPLIPSPAPLLIVLSGPSGAGKDAVLARMKQLSHPLVFITTMTTRPRRAQEVDGLDYRFVSKAEFQQSVERGDLLEWAKVYENWYGVPRQPVREALEKERDVVIKVDVQGAQTIRNLVPQAVFIFLTPPSLEELCQRLEQRHTESANDLSIRTRAAETEISQLPLFDYVVISRHNEADRAVADVISIITAEKCRVVQRQVSI